MNILNKIKQLFKKEPIKIIRPAYLDYEVAGKERYKNFIFINFTNGKTAIFKVFVDPLTNKEFLISVGYLLDDHEEIVASQSWNNLP